MWIMKDPDMRIPAKVWAGAVEESAQAQIRNLCQLPFAKFVSVMPDVHCGYGMPIGTVLATQGYVIPNAVGVDIGCGMVAAKTLLTEIDTQALKDAMGLIRQTVPVGFEHHKASQMEPVDLLIALMAQPGFGQGDYLPDHPIVEQQLQRATHQLGTLGGGNHFIEIQRGDDGHIWVMIHSGSRNLGKQVADHYNKIAVDLNERYFSQVTKDKQLAFLPLDSPEGQAYLVEMEACLKFALLNRSIMMERVLDALKTDPFETINIHHNYAVLENHHGQNVMVHRKGATSARLGQLGLIPGSQGTASYVVSGLGDPESLQSCSHGAGRRMGRGQAQRTLNLQEEQDRMNEKGIIHSVRNAKDLDEAPGAYKSIDVVMSEQQDLVEIVHRLEPMAVIKG